MVSRSLAGCLALASLGGCELVVDEGTRVLASAEAGGDEMREASRNESRDESGPADAAPTDVGVERDCSSDCLPQSTSCLQTCASTQASCVSSCHGHGSGTCQDRCDQTEADCNDGCISTCVACFTRAACAGSSACTH